MPDQEPIPPQSAPSPGPELGPKSTSTDLPSNVAAALACIPLIGGIIFYIIEKQDSFVRFYAMQSIILGAAWLVFYIAALNHLHGVFDAIPAYRWRPGIFLGHNLVALDLHCLPRSLDCRDGESIHKRALGHPLHRPDCAPTRTR